MTRIMNMRIFMNIIGRIKLLILDKIWKYDHELAALLSI